LNKSWYSHYQRVDGSIKVWGSSYPRGPDAPSDSGYTKIYSTASAFAVIKADGSITAWGDSSRGGSGAPSDHGYIKIYSTGDAFAAIKADGSITVWGDSVGTIPASIATPDYIGFKGGKGLII
jgi:hypothetical protein